MSKTGRIRGLIYARIRQVAACGPFKPSDISGITVSAARDNCRGLRRSGELSIIKAGMPGRWTGRETVYQATNKMRIAQFTNKQL